MGVESILGEYKNEIDGLNLPREQIGILLAADSRSELEKRLGDIYLGKATAQVVGSVLIGGGSSGIAYLLYQLGLSACGDDPMCNTLYKAGPSTLAIFGGGGAIALLGYSIKNFCKGVKHYSKSRKS